MRNQLNTRHILAFVLLCIFFGVGILFIQTRRRTSPSVPSEQVSKVSAPQEATPAEGVPAEGPPQEALSVQNPVEIGVKRLSVSPPPGQLSPSQFPPPMPPASQLPSEAEQKKEWLRQEEERIEALTAGMDAFTAAKYLYDNHYGANTEPYIRRFAAQALSENPNDFDTLLLYTNLLPYKRNAHNPEREAGFRKLLEINPNSLSALVGLAETIYWFQPEEAIEHLEKAKQQDPGLANAYLGFAYQRIGNYDKALEVLKARPENDIVAQAHLHGIESGEPYIPPLVRETRQTELEGPDETFTGSALDTETRFSTETDPAAGTDNMPSAETSGGISDAEWAEIQTLFENMTTQELYVFEQFIRDEFPEYAKFLDGEADTSESMSRKEIEAEFSDAYQTLKKYGPDEGLKRLQVENPRLARQIAHELKRRAVSRRQPKRQDKQPPSPSDE